MTSSHLRTCAILVAAGRGERLGGGIPKQFRRLGGRPLYAWSLDALCRHDAIDEVVMVVADDQLAHVPDGVRAVIGGATRQQSVKNALEALAAGGAVDQVLIHDAARPFLSAAVIDRLLAALAAHTGAVPALPVADSLRRGGTLMGEDVRRDGLYRIQTPQAFRFASLLAAHRTAGGGATDDAMLLAEDVALVDGDEHLFKVTSPADWQRAEHHLLAQCSDIRTGSGFDVHRFGPGDHLWLGGVKIPHDRGVLAHSDGDVALHALTDALLGTIGAGDIGVHFPPSDPQWRGGASSRFLEHAAGLITARGGVIAHVDLTIIAERPKLGGHRQAICASIAGLLDIAQERVSLKATTTEHLGFTGRGEGIAAQAIATVRLPLS